jgi:hypothetical protein
VSLTGPYRFIKTAGPAHLTFSDHGITFASNARQKVQMNFRCPVTGIDFVGLLHHLNLTVTVADCPALVTTINERLRARP